MLTAVYPGSFDPVTNGHLDIIERSAKLFDKLIVAVSLNPSKQPLFSVAERMDMLRSVLGEQDNIEIASYEGLTAEYAEDRGAKVLIRGLRAISDFENEFKMALTNKQLYQDVETVFLMTRAEYSFISSSVVKELASFGGDVSRFVPPEIEVRLRSKLT